MSIGGPTAQVPVVEERGTSAPPPPQRGGSARAREDRRTGYLLITPTVVIVFAMVDPADPVDHLAGLPAGAAAQPAQSPASSATTAWRTSPDVLTSPGFVDALVTTLDLLRGRDGLRDRARPARRARAAQAVPRAGVWCGPACSCRTSPPWSRRRSCGPRCSTRSSASPTTTSPRCSGSTSRSPSSAPRRTCRVFGIDLHVSTALFSVVMFEAWRSFPFAFLFLTARIQAIPEQPGGGGDGRRRDPDPALPPHRAAPAAADDRGADGAAVHLDVQQLRRHLPADRRRRGHPGRRRPRLRLPDQPRRHRRGRREALVLAAILAVLVGTYLKLFGRQEEVA